MIKINFKQINMMFVFLVSGGHFKKHGHQLKVMSKLELIELILL